MLMNNFIDHLKEVGTIKIQKKNFSRLNRQIVPVQIYSIALTNIRRDYSVE